MHDKTVLKYSTSAQSKSEWTDTLHASVAGVTGVRHKNCQPLLIINDMLRVTCTYVYFYAP